MPFNQAKADHVLEFARSLSLPDETGQLKPLELLPFQQDILRQVFGNVDAEGNRLCRTAMLSTARQNGKTTISAVIGLYFLAFNPTQIDIASCAGDRNQASIIFKYMAKLVESTPALARVMKIHKTYRTITNTRTQSRYIALGADGKLAHGYAYRVVLLDELHVFEDGKARELYDAVMSSRGAQKNPLVFITTTASGKASGLAYDEWTLAKQMQAEGSTSYLTFIHDNEPTCDIEDLHTWKRANPGLGKTKQLEYMQQAVAKALVSPAARHALLRLDLNVFGLGSESAWIDSTSWNACQQAINWDDFKGREAYLGLDLGSVRDLTGIVLVFPMGDGRFTVKPHAFMPADSIRERSTFDGVPYDVWADEGFLTATAGNSVDHEAIRDYIVSLAEQYTIKEVCFDRAAAHWLTQSLTTHHGLTCVPISQQFNGISDASKFFETKIRSGKLIHDGHPVMNHHISCATITRDTSDRIRPAKPNREKSKHRIDCVAATVNAFARAMFDDVQGVADLPDYEIRFV